MTMEESLQCHGLVPADASLPRIRELLAREAECGREDLPREEDLALLCCVQLFSRGALEDVLRIWEAKRSCMDLGAYLDAGLLCGAGLEKTKRFLAEHPSPEARKALTYLEGWERCEDFAEFSPDASLKHYRRYFDVA